MHRVLKDMLSHFVSENQQDWDEWIPYILMAYRGSVHSTAGYSPFFLLHGRDQTLPIDNFLGSQRVRYDCAENYVSELMGRVKKVYSQVNENPERAKGERIIRFNRKAKERKFVVGDLVYLKDESVKVGISKKLVKPWKGPYRIIEIVGPVTYKVRKVGSWEEAIVHINRLKPYHERQQCEETEDTSSESEVEEQTATKGECCDGADEGDNEAYIERQKTKFPAWVGDPRFLHEKIEVKETVDTEDEEEMTRDDNEVLNPIPLRRSTRIRRPPDRLSP